jgi:tetratricopeptide (TPR) repeat protein
MKLFRVVIILLFIVSAYNANAQQDDDEQVRMTAIQFCKKNDFSNALIVLNSGLKKNPTSLVLAKELAFTFYLSGSFEQAAINILPLVERIDADIQTFQIAGNIFNALEDWKQSEKMYRKGLSKYPMSGQLHSEYGQLLWQLEKPSKAIEQWEQGIIDDPSHSGNYYHASKFYFAAADKVRAIIYGEIFINLESFSKRTDEIKYQLYESYKRIFNPADVKVHYIKKTTQFEAYVLQGILDCQYLASNGINTSSLHEIRLGFMKKWFTSSVEKFPFSLFDRMKYLINNEMFESYNQWLFGMISNEAVFESWIRNNQEAYKNFLKFQENNLYRPRKEEHYF